MLTPEELAAIRAREQQATPGPWDAAADDDAHRVWMLQAGERPATYESHHVWECDHACYPGEPQYEQADADADFIAHARSDIPALLAYVEELEAAPWRASYLDMREQRDAMMRQAEAAERDVARLTALLGEARDAIREQKRAYDIFTPLTDDEVKRAVDAVVLTVGPWGSDRLHAQWARRVLANTLEALAKLDVVPPEPKE